MPYAYQSALGPGGDLYFLTVDADAPALFYTPRGSKGVTNYNSWVKESYLMPLKFNRDMTITRIGQRFTSIPTTGTLPNGADAWYYIYEGVDTDNGNVPANLVSNCGIVNVLNTGSSSKTVLKTLATPITMSAGVQYWIGSSHALPNGSGGYTTGTGPYFRETQDGGSDILASVGVTSSLIPAACLGFNCYYSDEIALGTFGTAPATLDDAQLLPQGFAPTVFVEGVPA